MGLWYLLTPSHGTGSIYTNAISNKFGVKTDLISSNNNNSLLLFRYGGHLSGLWCNYVPDVFFFSVILFFGTFTVATYLKKFKFSPYLPTKVRIIFTTIF